MKSSAIKPAGPSANGRLRVRIATWTVSAMLCLAGIIGIPGLATGQGHGGGGHSGGGHGGGGHAGGGGQVGGGGHAGGAAAHIGGDHVGGLGHAGSVGHVVGGPVSFSHPGFNPVDGMHQFGPIGHVGVATPTAHSAWAPVGAHAPGVSHSVFATPGQHFDVARWTGDHSGVPHSASVFGAGSGHVSWTPAHTSGMAHSTFGDAGHHFDASHWTSGHFGNAHHFSPLHHDDHHFGQHDFHYGHFGFVGLGLGVGFYGWSYPYYYSYPSYYAYPYYYSPAYYQDCPPSYYEAPVYPDTNSLYDGTSAPAAGAAATPYGGDRNVPKEVRVPDGFIPRMELPGREAPEALPEEKPVAPPREIPLSESPQSNGSKK